jgi:hypothetical protein
MIKFLLVNDTTSWRELLANIKVALVGISTELPSHRKSDRFVYISAMTLYANR